MNQKLKSVKMADNPTVESGTPAAAASAASPKAKKAKAASAGAKKPKSKPNHPPTSGIVNNAIKALKERGGSSLQAIKEVHFGKLQN